MERLGWWLCAGLAKLGGFESDGAGDALMSDDAVDDPAGMLFGGVLRESRIAYPLAMDAWQAVGEHLFEEQEDGVSVRYMHGIAAKAVAASQQAVQRVAVANGSAAKAAQGYSTAASRAQARQQAARKATVPPVPPKPVHVRSGPQRTFQGSTAQPQNLPRQEDDSGLLGLAVASTVLDDLASIQVPDIDISPSSDSISQDFSGDGGDFGGGGSTGEW